MKKIIFNSIAVLAIAATIAFNVNLSKQGNGLSDISLANLEALANESNENVKLYVHCEGTDVICLGEGKLRCCK